MKFYALVLALFLVPIGMGIAALTDQRHEQSCTAPCVVEFGPNMHEDEFCLDYRGDGTLRVWRQHVDECDR